MSKQAIIDKIVDDAKLKADSFLEEQNREAERLISEAAEQCKDILYRSQAEIALESEDILSRSKTVAELDARKLLLKKKQEILDSIFARTLEKLTQLPDAQMKKLLLGMLKFAEDGDVIVLNERGKALLTKAAVDRATAKRGVKVTLCEDAESFLGGMILRGGGVDKNLTFEVEVQLLKEEYETKIAGEIFA